MPTNNKSIQILRGTTTSGGESNVDKTILETGQPFYDKRTNTLRIGDGTNVVKNVNPVTVADGAINDAKVASDAAIKGSKLADASNDESNRTGITTAKIESNAITTEKIADDAITGNKISETASVYIQQLRVIKPDESTNPYDGLVRAERGVTCGTWLVAGNNYIQSKYMPEYIYYHNVNNREGKLLFPKRTLDSNGEVIATLNNIPKFQSINGNLYITT